MAHGGIKIMEIAAGRAGYDNSLGTLGTHGDICSFKGVGLHSFIEMWGQIGHVF
jgi:hypothetical protein